MATNDSDLQDLDSGTAREILEALGALVKTPGWEHLKVYVTNENTIKNGRVLAPCLNPEDTIATEGLKGEIRGAHFVLEFPARAIEELRRKLELEEVTAETPRYQENSALNPGHEVDDNA